MTAVLQITYTLNSITQAVHQFLQYAHDYRIWAFSGGMGSGKTTFCRAVGKAFGIKEELSSPTFSLMNEYSYEVDGMEKVLMHMDWYRIRDAEEAIDAGIENVLIDPRYRCWIEWPEQASVLIPNPYLLVQFSVGQNPEERVLEVFKIENDL